MKQDVLCLIRVPQRKYSASVTPPRPQPHALVLEHYLLVIWHSKGKNLCSWI